MGITQISDELFGYLMDRAGGTKFESLAKTAMAEEYGENFTPLGGIHDGGADGLISSFIQEGKKPHSFAQFTTMDGRKVKTKVLHTIDALIKAGRTPKHLLYCTSEALPKQDIVQTEVFEERSVLCTFRDRDRLRAIVNKNAQVNRTFLGAFSSEIRSITTVKAEISGAVNEFVTDPTVFVFLNHELRDRFSKAQLLARVLDALIYWTLRETDPDQSKIMTRTEIWAALEAVFPSAKSLLLPQLDVRLKVLSKKTSSGLERLRRYNSRDNGNAETGYCLPFDMRSVLAAETATVIKEQSAFLESLTARIGEAGSGTMSQGEIASGTQLAFDTIHQHFVEQGLLLAAFLEKRVDALMKDQVVEDEMAKVIATKKLKGMSPKVMASCLQALRGVFYDPRAEERLYLEYLCRTSLLCTTLNVAPKLLEYFNQMAGNFRLFVGTDLLVKAISESYLEPGQQQVTNLLKVMATLGSSLLLAEPILTELFTHLHGVDLEYRNHYQAQEQYFKEADITECNRILIRTYLYARHRHKGPRDWGKFINALLDPSDLRSKSEKGRRELQAYLVQKYALTFVSLEDLSHGVKEEEVRELAKQLHTARVDKKEELSRNDALMVYAVFAQRSKHGESAIYDGFGVKTWWLTKETQVLSLTPHLVRQHGVPYIMRPEFLLNFITLAPKAADVRRQFANLIPTSAGLQLGRHLDPKVINSLLDDVSEWAVQQPERVGVILSDKVNRLKYDRLKQYTHNL